MDVVSLLRLFLLFSSMGGFVCYVCDRLKIKLEFAPAIVFSGIVCILLLAGYLNVLVYAAYIIYFLGIILFIKYIIKKKLASIFHTGHAAFCVLFIIVLILYFTIRLQGARFSSYDDFSHWGVVVKDMLLNNRIPNTQSAVVSFKSYPLGSSLFLYYVNVIIGISESKMLFAQMLLSIAYVFAFFGSINTTKKIMPQAMMIVASVYMLAEYTDFWCLWVDTLLPLSGLAATAIILHYRHDIKRAARFAIPIMITSAMIKNSGIMFSLINIVILLYMTRRSNRYVLQWKERLNRYSNAIGTLAIVLLSMLLWYSHYDYVFPGIITKHTMSISSYQAVLGDKSLEEMAEVASQFIHKTISLGTVSTLYFFVVNLLTVVLSLAILLLFKKKVSSIVKALVFSDAVFILYMAGMLAMYLLSMPTEEAINLAAYARYASSAVIYHLGVLTIGYIFVYESSSELGALNQKEQTGRTNKQQFICGTCMLILIFAFGSVSIDRQSHAPRYETTLPATFEQVIAENMKGYTNKKYIVYYATNNPIPAITNSYLGYIAKYKLLTASVKIITKFNREIILAALPKYDDLIVVEADSTMEEFMSEFIDKTDYKGVYQIKKTFFPNGS